MQASVCLAKAYADYPAQLFTQKEFKMTVPSRYQKLAIPPLENGAHLSRSEFERRYAAMTEVKKAALIEGTVYIASPLRFDPHAESHADVTVAQ